MEESQTAKVMDLLCMVTHFPHVIRDVVFDYVRPSFTNSIDSWTQDLKQLCTQLKNSPPIRIRADNEGRRIYLHLEPALESKAVVLTILFDLWNQIQHGTICQSYNMSYNKGLHLATNEYDQSTDDNRICLGNFISDLDNVVTSLKLNWTSKFIYADSFTPQKNSKCQYEQLLQKNNVFWSTSITNQKTPFKSRICETRLWNLVLNKQIFSIKTFFNKNDLAYHISQIMIARCVFLVRIQ